MGIERQQERASWCAPCLAEIPTLQLINKNHKNDVAIISFSIGIKKDDWIKSMNENKIVWYSFSDLKGAKGKFTSYFSVHEIPLLILLNEKTKY